MKIATHDSATGEQGRGFLSWLITPFAKTQSKTIRKQYEAGCRMFDIRVKIKDVWRCAYGLWVTKRSADDILKEINSFVEPCYVTITYEGNADNVYRFTEFIKYLQTRYTNIKYGGIVVKYGKKANLFKVIYDYIQPYPNNYPANKRGFLPLDGSSWHIILPIPWLWKKIYYNKPKFNNDYYLYVDFL